MTFKARRILFYSFLFLFILTGLGVVLYSRGWRVDVANCEMARWRDCRIGFNKIGAIFIETEPGDVVIKIDGKSFPDKSGLIQNGTLITNLLPKTYKVKIEKDGYLSWQKNIRVEPALVAEVLRVILIPAKLEKTPISIPKPIHNFWLNSQLKIIFKNQEALYYLQGLSLSKLKGDEVIQWSEDGNGIILRDSKSQIYYLYESADLSKTLNISAILNNFQKTNIVEIAFHPIELDQLIIRGKNDLYLLNLTRLKLESLLKEPLLAWAVTDPNIYYVRQIQDLTSKTEIYYLASFNLVSKIEDLMKELPDNLISQKPIKISISGNKIAILTNNGSLYLFNQETRVFQQIAQAAAQNPIFSPDSKKIAFFDRDGKLSVYFLEDYQMGINKKAGETIDLAFYPKAKDQAIKNIFWHKDSYHLFIETLTNTDKTQTNTDSPRVSVSSPLMSVSVDFVEIDNRPPINKYTLVEGASNFYYESNSNRLYFIKEKGLYFIEF